MFRLFAKIRYEPTGKNKTGQYMRYALGEMVLIVIAILMVLQINNWNEKRKVSTYKTQKLQENYSSLQRDSPHLEVLKQSKIEINFNFEKGAYETLKSGGLEYISNDSLQTLLVSMYEV